MELFINKANKQLIEEWHEEKNVESIDTIGAFSSKKVWWKCKLGHEWQATVDHRMRGTNCPYCSGRKVLVGFNDLQSQNPEIAAEWNCDKNGSLTPEMVTCSSNKRIWWQCQKCNYEWITAVSCRKRGTGCPICSKKKRALESSIAPEEESLLAVRPDLAKEWNYNKNGDLSPAMVYPSSNKKVWWKCSEGHEWQAVIGHRKSGTNCPYCSGRKVLVGFNDLLTCYPDIAGEWNCDKNGSLTPEMVTGGSNKSIWWKCKKGHEWYVSVNSRVSQNSGCPYCSNVKMLSGYNDLKTLYPELLSEWDYSKNSKDPSEYASASKESVWWICKKGHEWKARIANRSILKRGCPVCAKELSTSFPEQALFYYVQKYYPEAVNGDKNRLNGVELDIYIPSVNTAIEYDGKAWHSQEGAKTREIKKNEMCKNAGIRLIRIREQGLDNYDNCICINRRNNASESDLEITIDSLLREIGVNDSSVDLDRDRGEIQEGIDYRNKQNSLQELYPEIAKEWDFEKNGKLSPEMVSPQSNKRIWWKCDKGHSWIVSVNNRLKTNGCPVCGGFELFEGFNDLLTKNPDIAKEWNYEKNGSLAPKAIRYNSSEKVWWKCEKGHEWQTTPYHRCVQNTGCPFCLIDRRAQQKSTPKQGDSLHDLYPQISCEWDYEKNGDVLPSMVKPKSAKIVWWKCKQGHEWKAKIQNRTSLNRGCPYCSGRYAISGETDLLTKNPKLAKEWNYEKNDDLKPSDVLPASNKKVWWKCKYGHEWQATVNSRNSGCGCPFCVGRKAE